LEALQETPPLLIETDILLLRLQSGGIPLKSLYEEKRKQLHSFADKK
jgi:hypothetical protein